MSSPAEPTRLVGPDEAYRIVYLPDGRVRARGYEVPLYADEDATIPADVLTVDGDPISDSTVVVDAYSRIPLFQYPPDTDVVYTSINAGPVVPLYARVDDRLDQLTGAVDDLDEAVTAESTARATLPTTYAALSGNIQATVRKLAEDVGDVTVLSLGDSTAAQAGQWPFLLMPLVQALYPHRTLKQSVWSGSAYPTLSTVTSGTGTNSINFYQGAQSGTVPESVFADWEARIAAVQPDLVTVHYGHNYGATAAGGGFASDLIMDQVTRERFTRFIAQIKLTCPTADVLITSQNPYLTAGARTGLSTIRAQVWRDLAADLGCAYGPILEAYQATGNPAAYLGADGLHPLTSGSTNGAELAANALLPLFRYQAHVPPSARVPSPLLTVAPNLLTNGDFASFTSPPTLPSWTAQFTTLSKNTTQYESRNGYSVQIAAAAGSGNANLYQSTPPINLARIKGQVVTAAARVWVPAASSSSAGRIQVSGGGVTTVSSGTPSLIKDQWVWISATTRVPSNATFLTVSLLCGTAGSTDVMHVDRAVLVLGHLPREAV